METNNKILSPGTEIGTFRIQCFRDDHPPNGQSYLAIDKLGRKVRLWIIPQTLELNIPPHHDRFVEVFESQKNHNGDQLLATSIPGGRLLEDFFHWSKTLPHWQGVDFVEWLANTPEQSFFRPETLKNRDHLQNGSAACIVGFLVEQMLESHELLNQSPKHPHWQAQHIWIDPVGSIRLDPMFFSDNKPANSLEIMTIINRLVRSTPLTSSWTDKLRGSQDEAFRRIQHLAASQRVEDLMPKSTNWSRWSQDHPLLAVTAILVLTNAIASVLQVSYNSVFIVGRLSSVQQNLFAQLVLPWNICVFITAASLFLWRFRLALRAFSNKLQTSRSLEQSTLSIPGFAGFLIVSGWTCGCLLFTTALHHFASPLPIQAIMHFIISFGLATAIAWSYSVASLTYLCIRNFYPLVSLGGKLTQQQNRSLENKILFTNLLAGGTPLAAAILIVLTGPEAIASGQIDQFRQLLALFVITGIAGFLYTNRISRLTTKIIEVLSPTES